jgi:hypothetical protein
MVLVLGMLSVVPLTQMAVPQNGEVAEAVRPTLREPQAKKVAAVSRVVPEVVQVEA